MSEGLSLPVVPLYQRIGNGLDETRRRVPKGGRNTCFRRGRISAPRLTLGELLPSAPFSSRGRGGGLSPSLHGGKEESPRFDALQPRRGGGRGGGQVLPGREEDDIFRPTPQKFGGGRGTRKGRRGTFFEVPGAGRKKRRTDGGKCYRRLSSPHSGWRAPKGGSLIFL